MLDTKASSEQKSWSRQRQLERPCEFDHSLPHSWVRKPFTFCLHVVFKMLRLASRWDGAGHGWIGNDPFQKKLRPGSTIEFRRPFGQLFGAHTIEEVTATEGAIDDHRDGALLRQRQNLFFGFAFH